jgi:pimeloyl-ACP methyl ester carboxylesterase
VPLRSYLDGRVFADVSDGPGPLIVGLHGWGRDRNDLRDALSGFAQIRLDLPGFGLSPRPAQRCGSAEYAALVAAVLDEHARGGSGPAGPAVLVGHSNGGRVAACLAAARPDLVRGLVLCGAPLLRDPGQGRPALSYRLARSARRARLLSGRRFEAIRRSRASADYNAATGVMREVLVTVVNESLEAQLRAITSPVALLWGRGDRAVPPAMADRAAALLAGPVTTEIVDGAGHDVHLQAPARVGAAIGWVLAAGPAEPKALGAAAPSALGAGPGAP